MRGLISTRSTGRRVIRSIAALAAMGLLAPATAVAQYGGGASENTAAGKPLPPFLAAMKRHDIKVAVKIRGADGSMRAAPAGLQVGIRILAQGSKVRDYYNKTGPDGTAVLQGVPSNPEVQGMIAYESWVDFQGVRFPYELDGVPTNGSELSLTAHDVTTETANLSIDHSIEAFPDEESLVVRHTMRLYNEGPLAVNLRAMPGGGLKLPCPDGAKHPELHNEHDPAVEVRGTDIVYKGALLPASIGRPASVSMIYTIPYGPEVLEWTQTMPVTTRGVTAVVPQHKQKQAREAIPMTLMTRGAFGSVSPVEQPEGRKYQVLSSDGATLKPGEPLRFAIGNLPADSNMPMTLLILGVIAVIGIVAFGFRRPEGKSGAVMSRTHLVAERDRLVRALARMRRAVEKGRMSETRFDREREAITARLVSLYRALDRLDAR